MHLPVQHRNGCFIREYIEADPLSLTVGKPLVIKTCTFKLRKTKGILKGINFKPVYQAKQITFLSRMISGLQSQK